MPTRDNKAGTRLDFRLGKGGVRRAVSDAIAAIGWDEGEEGYVVLRLNRPRAEIHVDTVSLREAYRLLEQTFVRYADELEAIGTEVAELTESGKWRLPAVCADGQTRIFYAKDYAARPERSAMSPDRRFRILQRDAFTCRYCGRAAPDVVLHVDHVKPVARGGKSDDGNLVTACADCNHGKGARDAA